MSKALIANGAGSVIGMVHCLPLPGSFGYGGDMEKILSQAVQDAQTLEKAGVDAVIVENMGDTPFTAKLNQAQIAALTAAARKQAPPLSGCRCLWIPCCSPTASSIPVPTTA